MGKRRDFPALGGESNVTLEELVEHLGGWRADTLDTIDLVRAHRDEVRANFNLLENPNAVLEYLDAFEALFVHVAAELERTTGALSEGHAPSTEVADDHAAALRQIASNAAAEQRRCLMFRDKWINRPLPHEQVRPLLNRISIDTRDQLLEHQKLNLAAGRLVELARGSSTPQEADGSFNRRALFTRFLPRRD